MTLTRIGRTLATVLLFLGTVALQAQSQLNTGTPIIFVHGNGDDASKWIGVIWLFESNGYPADKLFAVRFPHPSARADDTRDEANRSSTTDEATELSAFVTRVLIQTHAHKVALVGSSRGGLTIRNYLLHGGSANVAYAVLSGTPNHGVQATDKNHNGEFNGKGNFLTSLNSSSSDGSEVVPGVKMMTLRSDKLDKYAQPTGIAFGTPQAVTNVTFEGPALRGASNLVLPNLDHRELAFYPTAFAEMYKFVTGTSPRQMSVIPEDNPVISGLITGFDNGAFTNLPMSGVHLSIYPIDTAKGIESSTPGYEVTTKEDGKWGPFQTASGQEYDFDLEYQGRHVRFYKAPLPRSTTLLNLRFMPAPRTDESGSRAHMSQILIARPQGYFSRDRDPVQIDGKLSTDEPGGLPIRDSFVAKLPTTSNRLTQVTLRNETIWIGSSENLAKDLPIVDFMW
jgi:pimeloyl-ACP methyl ester carboxylesterase